MEQADIARNHPWSLLIEFDGRQLAFRTNVYNAYEHVTETFQHMLADERTESAGELAIFETAKGYSLESATSLEYSGTPLEELIPLVKDEVRLQFMRGRPDLLWLHAGVVERDGGALLLSGTSGQGKSTLTTYLCQHGWRYMSDDVAPLRMDVNVVLPFPQSPVRRLHPGREVSRDELGTLERETVAVTSVQICHEPTEIRGIVFIAYAKGRKAELVRLEQGSGAMELLRNATNFFDHKASAVAKAAELGRRIPMYSLDYGIPGPAAELLNGLW